MQKRGQLTIFLVIGIILILAVLFLTNLPQEDFEDEIVKERSSPVQSFVETCLHDVGMEAAYFVARRGGMFFPTSSSAYFSDEWIKFYFEDGQNKMPTNEDVELAIESYIAVNLDSCLQNFSVFTDQQIDVVPKSHLIILGADPGDDSEEEIDVPLDVTIAQSDVVVTMSRPLFVTQAGREQEISEVSTRIDFDMNSILNIAREFMVAQEQSKNAMPIGVLNTLARKHDFTYRIVPYFDTGANVNFFFEKDVDDDVLFSFINIYDWSFDQQQENIGGLG